MSNKRYWQKTKGTKNFMKIVWKRLEVMIRFATEEDAEELLRIYSYYVENTAITFEYDTPALDEFKYRIRTIKAMYPYLVSEVDGKIVGYAYANTFKDRAAYDWAGKRLWQGTLRSFGESTESPEHNKSLCLYWVS